MAKKLTLPHLFPSLTVLSILFLAVRTSSVLVPGNFSRPLVALLLLSPLLL